MDHFEHNTKARSFLVRKWFMLSIIQTRNPFCRKMGHLEHNKKAEMLFASEIGHFEDNTKARSVLGGKWFILSTIKRGDPFW